MARELKSESQIAALLEAQMTPAARIGLVLLAALLCIQGLRLFYDRTQVLQQEAAYLASEISAMSDETLLPAWTARARSAEAAAQAWSGLAWRAAAPGIAAAEIEAALRVHLAAGRFEELRLEVNPEPIETGRIRQLRFSLSGEVAKTRAHALLAELSASKPLLQVTSLQFAKQGKEKFSVEIEGVAPYMED